MLTLVGREARGRKGYGGRQAPSLRQKGASGEFFKWHAFSSIKPQQAGKFSVNHLLVKIVFDFLRARLITGASSSVSSWLNAANVVPVREHRSQAPASRIYRPHQFRYSAMQSRNHRNADRHRSISATGMPSISPSAPVTDGTGRHPRRRASLSLHGSV